MTHLLTRDLLLHCPVFLLCPASLGSGGNTAVVCSIHSVFLGIFMKKSKSLGGGSWVANNGSGVATIDYDSLWFGS